MVDTNLPPSRGGVGRYLVRAGIFLLALIALGWLFHAPLRDGFHANVYLNATIIGIFVFGVGYTLKALVDLLVDGRATAQAAGLVAAVHRGERATGEVTEVLLRVRRPGIRDFFATVHRVLRHGDAGGTLPYLLDSMAARGEDRRALVRYLTGALVLLGLIGTFYGLLVTIAGVREVLGGLSGDPTTDTVELLAGLKERLAVPLRGMGMAFSTSLFGLLASLALAFLELQLFHAQNSVHTRLESLVVSDLVPLWQGGSRATTTATAEPAGQRYLEAVLESTAERMERVVAAMEAGARHDAGARLAEQLVALGQGIESLRATLDGLERDRTETLRHELRTLTRTLAAGSGQEDHAPPG